jgi:hypothetical protein
LLIAAAVVVARDDLLGLISFLAGHLVFARQGYDSPFCTLFTARLCSASLWRWPGLDLV